MDRRDLGGLAMGPLAAVAMSDLPFPAQVATHVFSFIVAALRIAGVKTEAYQAVAHLWVGGLFGAWLFSWNRGLLFQFIVLCVVEVLCFIWGLLP